MLPNKVVASNEMLPPTGGCDHVAFAGREALWTPAAPDCGGLPADQKVTRGERWVTSSLRHPVTKLREAIRQSSCRRAPDGLAQLLQCPGGRRMCGDVEVNQATTAVLDDDEYVEHPERGGY